MFQLSKEEFQNLIFQNGISKSRGGTRKLPYPFTEQGVEMLSSVLNSDTAIQVNIQIIKVFTKKKQMLLYNKELFIKIDKLQKGAIQIDAGKSGWWGHQPRLGLGRCPHRQKLIATI